MRSYQCLHCVCEVHFGVDHGLLDAPLPVVAKLLFVLWSLVSVDYGSRGIYERACPIGFAEADAVLRCGALRAVPRDEEPYLFILVAQSFGYVGRCAAHNHSYVAVAVSSYSFGYIAYAGDDFGDSFIHCLAVGAGEILYLRGGRVACPHEHEDAFALLCGHLCKRLDSVGSDVAVDGYSIGGEGILEAGQLGVLEMGGGIEFCGVAYVAAFDVSDYFKAEVVGLCYQGVVGLYAFPEILLEEGHIYFHSRDHRSNYSHSLGAEIEDCIDGGIGVKFIIHVSMALNRSGKSVIYRVQPDNQ